MRILGHQHNFVTLLLFSCPPPPLHQVHCVVMITLEISTARPSVGGEQMPSGFIAMRTMQHYQILNLPFLQRVSIACYAERCLSHDRFCLYDGLTV